MNHENFINVMEFTNLPVDEASKIVGNATDNPMIGIDCIIYDASSGREIESLRVNPFACAEKDDQEKLRQITTAMSQGGEEFDAVTILREFKP